MRLPIPFRRHDKSFGTVPNVSLLDNGPFNEELWSPQKSHYGKTQRPTSSIQQDLLWWGPGVQETNTYGHMGVSFKWWYPQTTPKWSFLVGKPIVVVYHPARANQRLEVQGEPALEGAGPAGFDRVWTEMLKLKLNIPSWELTYPLKSPFWRWFSFSPGGIC